MAADPFVCVVGIAPTVGDTAIGQSILQGLKRRHEGLIRVHADRPEVFRGLPELDEADEALGRLPPVPLPPLTSAWLPFRLRRLLRDLRRTGGAHTLPPATYRALDDALDGCAAVIFQGGPNWNDQWMSGRKALERWLFLEVARFRGVRAYHVGVSCGPFAWPYPRRLWMAPLCRHALERYDMLFVRDRFSRPALDRLGVRTHVVESTDAAVFLQPRRDPAFASVEDRVRATARRKVVVCVRDYQRRYPTALAARDRALEALAAVLDHVQRTLADVFFLSTDHNPQPEKATDVEVARQVQAMMTVPGSVVIDTDVWNPSALKHIYGQFDAMISMRLHPTILALEMGVPCLLLSYADKCQDFFSRLDLARYLVPLDAFEREPGIQQITGMLADTTLPSRITARYQQLKASHAADYEPMYRQIAARARELAEGGGAPKLSVAFSEA